MPSVHFRILLWRTGTKVPLMLLFAVSLHIHQSHLIISLKTSSESSVKVFNCKTYSTYDLNTHPCIMRLKHTTQSNKDTGKGTQVFGHHRREMEDKIKFVSKISSV
jgi:hypothetical protein